MAHVFISYSHKDSQYAHRLAAVLDEAGIPVWIDKRIDYGTKWPHVIQEQLDSCTAFIVIMSPRSYQSEWVQNELSRAKRKKKPIFPLLLDGEEPWLSVEATQFADVRGGKLPPDDFYTLLDVFVPRRPEETASGQAVFGGHSLAGGTAFGLRSKLKLPKNKEPLIGYIAAALLFFLISLDALEVGLLGNILMSLFMGLIGTAFGGAMRVFRTTPGARIGLLIGEVTGLLLGLSTPVPPEKTGSLVFIISRVYINVLMMAVTGWVTGRVISAARGLVVRIGSGVQAVVKK